MGGENIGGPTPGRGGCCRIAAITNRAVYAYGFTGLKTIEMILRSKLFPVLA
jgi:hypothetical protein